MIIYPYQLRIFLGPKPLLLAPNQAHESENPWHIPEPPLRQAPTRGYVDGEVAAVTSPQGIA